MDCCSGGMYNVRSRERNSLLQYRFFYDYFQRRFGWSRAEITFDFPLAALLTPSPATSRLGRSSIPIQCGATPEGIVRPGCGLLKIIESPTRTRANIIFFGHLMKSGFTKTRFSTSTSFNAMRALAFPITRLWSLDVGVSSLVRTSILSSCKTMIGISTPVF